MAKKLAKKSKKTEDNSLKIKLLGAVAFLFGLQTALYFYVAPAFLEQIVGLKWVSFFYFLSYIGSLVVLLNMHHLIKRYSKSNVALLLFGFNLVALLLAAVLVDHYVSVIFIAYALMLMVLMLTSLDVLIENFSHDKTTGSTRGLFLTLLNLGFLAGPFLSTFLVENFGFQWTFFASAVATLAAFLILLFWFGDINHQVRRANTIKAIALKMVKKSDVGRIYWIAFLLDFFYAVIAVYIPIYLLDIGITLIEMGMIFTVALIPFVLIEYPLGILMDKKTGEKEWLGISLSILFLGSLLISLFSVPKVGLWMVILVTGRIGAAILEEARDSYFYKQVGPRDVDLIDFFRTTRPLSFILAMIIASLVLLWAPVRMVFVVLALAIASGFIPLWKLKDTK